MCECIVTLHVSVWVEIYFLFAHCVSFSVTLHVSVWVEMHCQQICQLLLHSHAPRERVSWNRSISPMFAQGEPSRSTWACELKYSIWAFHQLSDKSRSTWACELKSILEHNIQNQVSHAPRERVSWNCDLSGMVCHCSRHAPRERVSWNASYRNAAAFSCCHAPRERVSWNDHMF